MQHTIKTIADAIQKGTSHDEAGLQLAVSMAKDEMSYHDAHEKIHYLEKVLECAEKHLAKAAFKELARDGKRINPAHMMTENPDKQY